MDIKTFTIARFDLEFVLCWKKKEKEYYIQAIEHGEWVEDFSDVLPGQPLPSVRDDERAIAATQAYVDHIQEEMEGESHTITTQPDWEAQARYDEAHGTINSEDPNVARWKEEFGYY